MPVFIMKIIRTFQLMKTTHFTFFIFSFLIVFSGKIQSQIIFYENFSGIPLVNGCAHLPVGYTSIKTDTLQNSPDLLNSPFNDPSYSTDAWAIKVINNDTCGVSTSAVNSSGLTDRWIVTPVIYGINAQSMLMWKDASYSPFNNYSDDIYEVRITTDTTLPIQTTQFTSSSQSLIAWPGGSNKGFTSRSVNLSAFSGFPVRIAFRKKDSFPFANWQLIIDDITVINSANSFNLASESLFVESFSNAGDSLSIWERFSNIGTTINGYTWHVVIGNFFNDSLVLSNIFYSGMSDFHAMRLRLPNIAPGIYTVKTWTSRQYMTDFFPSNDTLTAEIRILSLPVNRNVLAEETTGAWCGYCPQGGVELTSLAAQRPWLIPVSIHTGDSMTLRSGIGIAYYYDWGFPSIDFDRINLNNDPNYWSENDFSRWSLLADNRHPHASPASVSIINQTYDWQTRQMSVTVAATFFNDATGPFRMNCWLTENNVTGPLNDTTDNHWNNHSYFNADTTSTFFGMGTLLDATEYQHQHVLDTTLSNGPWGDAGIIPDTVLAGSTFVHTYTFTLPVQAGYAMRWKPLDISAVAFVSVYDDFPHNQFIVNAGTGSIVTNVLSYFGNSNMISVYPNPADEEIGVKIILKNAGDVKMELFSLEGQLLISSEYEKLGIGENNIVLNLSGFSEGVYILKVTSVGGTSACKIVHRN